MKTTALVFAVFSICLLCAPVAFAQNTISTTGAITTPQPTMTVNDVLKLSRAGVSHDMIT